MEEAGVQEEPSFTETVSEDNMNGGVSHSAPTITTNEEQVDGTALAENDLLGFAMPSSSSNGDLLGFSTPQETLSTDDLLDFASAPTSMSTSPETEQVGVYQQQEENVDLLGFGSSPGVAPAAEHTRPVVEQQSQTTSTTTADDLLDLMSAEPVEQSIISENTGVSEPKTMEGVSSQSDALDVFSSSAEAQPVADDKPAASEIPAAEREPAESKLELPTEETVAEAPVINDDAPSPLLDVFSTEQQPVSASETGEDLAADNVPEGGKDEAPTEETPKPSQQEVPLETESNPAVDGKEEDAAAAPANVPAESVDPAANGSDLPQSEVPVLDTASPDAPVDDKDQTETEASGLEDVAMETNASDMPTLEMSPPSVAVDTASNNIEASQIVEADALESITPLSKDANTNSMAEAAKGDDATPPEGGGDQVVMATAPAEPNVADQGESIESQPESQEVIPEEAKDDTLPAQESESMDDVELDATDNDISVEDEEEGMAEVSLDTEPVKPPVVAAPSEHTVLSDTLAKSVQQADPWQMDYSAASNASDSKESVNEDKESTNEPAASNTRPVSEPSPTMVAIPPPATSGQSSDHSAENDALLVELQSSLQDHMSKQAEAEDRARKAETRTKQLEQDLQAKEKAETELEAMKGRMKSVVSDKANLELELAKLRAARDEHERKEIVLSNRLNAAKKKEAVKADLAERLEDEVKELQAELNATKEKLSEAEGSGQKTEKTLEETTQQMTERVRVAETALADERRLNEDRKKKMKAFIESKQEEVRQGKLQTDELNAELEQTNRLLRDQNSRWKQLHAQWVQSQTRNRELQRDLNRIKKDSDNMHKIGDKMEMKLSKSAQETEEHKNKRLTAKHELMTILRTLEAEREVSAKLRDSLKFTFTPKALSQQQLLKESLRDFDTELQQLSRRLGRPLPPSIDSPAILSDDDETEGDGAISESIDSDAVEEGKDGALNRSELDSNHLITNLENETQRVSQCIMALTSSIERMHIVLDESGPNTCINALTNILMGNPPPQTNNIERASMTGASLRSTRYGQVPQANRDY